MHYYYKSICAAELTVSGFSRIYWFVHFVTICFMIYYWDFTYISASRSCVDPSCRAPWLLGGGAPALYGGDAAGAGAVRDTIAPALRRSRSTPVCSRDCAKYLMVKITLMS